MTANGENVQAPPVPYAYPYPAAYPYGYPAYYGARWSSPPVIGIGVGYGGYWGRGYGWGRPYYGRY